MTEIPKTQSYRDADAVKEILGDARRVRILCDVLHGPNPYCMGLPEQEVKVLYRGADAWYVILCRFYSVRPPEERVMKLPGDLDAASVPAYEAEHTEAYSPWYDMAADDG